MSTFAFAAAGKLHIVVDLCPERREALADCVGQAAGFSLENARASVFVGEETRHVVVGLRPEEKTATSRCVDRPDYVLVRVESSPSRTVYTYGVKQ